MAGTSSHSEIAATAIKCFADDGNLDLGELNVLIGLALRDNEITDEERRIVGDILIKLTPSNVTPVVWKRVLEIQERHNL